MPFGAYKINPWGGTGANNPVIPSGISQLTYVFTPATQNQINPSNANYTNMLFHQGISQTSTSSTPKLFWSAGHGSGQNIFSIDYDSSTFASGSTLTNFNYGSGASSFNESIAMTANRAGNGQSFQFFANAFTNASNTLSVQILWGNTGTNTVFGRYGATTNMVNGSTTSGSSTVLWETDKSVAVTGSWAPIGYPSPIRQMSNFTFMVFAAYLNRSGQYQYNSWGLDSTSGYLMQMNITESRTTNTNYDNGLRLDSFTQTSPTATKFPYVGYSSTSGLTIGVMNYNSSTSLSLYHFGNIGSWSIGDAKTAMLKTIWNDWENGIYIAAVLYQNQYLKFFQFNNSTGTFANYTGNWIPISDSPNFTYRLLKTGIDGLGCLAYLLNNRCYIKFFSVGTFTNPIGAFNNYTITWGNAIDLGAVPINNVTIFNADVSYTSGGFAVNMFFSDLTQTQWSTATVPNNRFLFGILYPTNRTSGQNLYQNPVASCQLQLVAYPNIYTKLSPTQKKFGVSSLYSNLSSGSTATTFPGRSLNKVTQSWTIEFWHYLEFSNGYLFSIGVINTNDQLAIGNSNGTVFYTNGSGNTITASSEIDMLVWNHIAVTYDHTTVTTRLYCNGILVGQGIIPVINFASLVAGNVCCLNSSANSGGPIGYMDEFRISNVARYTTSSFTPQTGPFSNDANTICLYHFNGKNGSLNIYDDWGPNYSG